MNIISQEWNEVELYKKEKTPDKVEKVKKPYLKISNAAIHTLTPCVRLAILNQRIVKGWTISDLAHKIGESIDKIRGYENGTDFPDANSIQKLQTVLEIKLLPI